MTDPNEPKDAGGGEQQPADPWAPPAAAPPSEAAAPAPQWGQQPAGESTAAPQPQWSAPASGETPSAPQQWGQPGGAQWGQQPGQAASWGAPPPPSGGDAAGWGQQQPSAAPSWGQQQPAQPSGWGAAPQGQQPGGAQWGQQPGQAASWGAPPPGQQQVPGQQAPGQQWGQPGQPGWGADPQGQQPGGPQAAPHWGQQPAGAAGWQQPGTSGASGTPGPKSKTSLILAGVGALVIVVVALLGLVLFGNFGTATLEAGAAETGVAKVLTESYGASQVGNVSCPEGQEVASGNSFDCTVTVDGQHRTVTLTFTDDNGTYEVSRPH